MLSGEEPKWFPTLNISYINGGSPDNSHETQSLYSIMHINSTYRHAGQTQVRLRNSQESENVRYYWRQYSLGNYKEASMDCQK